MERFTSPVADTLWSLLERRFPGWKRNTLRARVREGLVSVDGVPVTRGSHPVAAGATIEVQDGGIASKGLLAGRGLQVLFDDEALVVVDKPAGLLSVATHGDREKNVLEQVRQALERGRGRKARVFAVHRIDRGTSGLLIVARTLEAREALQARWHELEKTYLTVVEGALLPDEGTVHLRLREGRDMNVYVADGAPDAKDAVSHFRVVFRSPQWSLVEVRLETGRKHQIRVSLAHLGHPVVGDARYGARTDPIGRLALHAHRLRFPHPITGAWMVFESPMPNTFRQLVGSLGETRRG